MNIDWFTFFAQIINFAVLVYVLHYFLYEPLTNAMQAREQTIADRLADAEQREAEAQSRSEEYRELSSQLGDQTSKLMDDARRESETLRQRLFSEAKADVELRRQEWLESLNQDQDALVRLFRQRVGHQVVAVSQKALSQLAGSDLEQRSLELFLEELNDLPASDIETLIREYESSPPAQIHTAFPITDKWKRQIQQALADSLGFQAIQFMTSPELVFGVELRVGGSKIGWSAQEYLESLTEDLNGMFAKQLDS